MRNSRDHASELAQLVGQLADGLLTDAGRARLADLLRNDPAARAYYLDYIDLHVGLQWEHALADGTDTATAAEASEIVASRLAAEDEGAGDEGAGGECFLSGEEQDELPAADGRPGSLAGQRASSFSASSAPPPSTLLRNGSSFFPGFSGPVGVVLVCYLIVVLTVGAGLLAAWKWGAHGASRQVATDASAPAVGPGPVAVVSGMADCRWAEDGGRLAGATGPGLADGGLARGMGVSLGRRIVLVSGVLEIIYHRSRAEVILQGPADYTVDSANGGFLAAGRATVRLVKNGKEGRGESGERRGEGGRVRETHQAGSADGAFHAPYAAAFALRTPASLITNLGAESGIEIGRSSEFGVVVEGPLVSRTCVFRGKAAVELLDGQGSLPAIPVDAGHSVVAERSSPARQGMIFVDDAPGNPALFAHRVHVPSPGDQQHEQQHHVAWLKAIGRGPERKLVAVGTGEDIELPPGDDSASFGDGSQTAEPGLRPAVTYTCRLTFDLRDLDPGTAMLQFQYLAHNRIAAIRLNGHEIPRTRRPNRELRQDVGQFTIRGGMGHAVFVRGINHLDIDVDDQQAVDGPPLLRILHEESAIYVPRRDEGRAPSP